jgi:2-polyprenyl-3-methyl-5-hydroxy-6-metoxy-1,4-benzoquinol methylase
LPKNSASSEQICPFCGGPGQTYSRHARFRKCGSCGLIVRTNTVTETDLARLYEHSWLHPESCRSETGGTELVHSRIYARKLANSLGLSDFSGLTLCDFGAGRGSMASALSELGADIYAIEPFGFDFLVSQGIKAFKSMEELPSNLRFDGIVSISVLEHLETPWREISAMRERLKPSGWTYLATPNANGLTARWNGDDWREATRPGHLVLLTPRSMARMLKQAGFGRYQRLKWYVAYRPGIRMYLGYLLQMFRVDGELRYLAFK